MPWNLFGTLSTDSLPSAKTMEKSVSTNLPMASATAAKRPALSSRAYSDIVTSSGDNDDSMYFMHHRDSFLAKRHGFTGDVFGVSLSDSLAVASTDIIAQSELAAIGSIPMVVAKSGAFLKNEGLKSSGIFRIAGNSKRIKDLQEVFSSPPDYGAKFDSWADYTVHDAASLLRRYLNHLQEPLIPLNMYESFRQPLKKRPRVLAYINDNYTHEGDAEAEDVDEAESKKLARKKQKLARDIKSALNEYHDLCAQLANDNRQLLIYLLDLLSLFTTHSEYNLMTARNLSAIFQPSILFHPSHDMSPDEYEISRLIVEFLIEYSHRLLPDLLKLPSSKRNVKNLAVPTKTPVTPGSSRPSSPMSARAIDATNTLRAPTMSRPHSKSLSTPNSATDIVASAKRRSRLFSWIHISSVLSDTGDLTATEEEDEEVDDSTDASGYRTPSSIKSSSSPKPMLAPRRSRSSSGTIDSKGNFLSSKRSGSSLSFNVRPMSMIFSKNKSVDNLTRSIPTITTSPPPTSSACSSPATEVSNSSKLSNPIFSDAAKVSTSESFTKEAVEKPAGEIPSGIQQLEIVEMPKLQTDSRKTRTKKRQSWFQRLRSRSRSTSRN